MKHQIQLILFVCSFFPVSSWGDQTGGEWVRASQVSRSTYNQNLEATAFEFVNPRNPNAPVLRIAVTANPNENQQAYQRNLQVVRNAGYELHGEAAQRRNNACRGLGAMGPSCLRALKGVLPEDLALKRTVEEIRSRNGINMGHQIRQVVHEIKEEYPADVIGFALAQVIIVRSSPLAQDPAFWQHYLEGQFTDPWTHAQLLAMIAFDPVLRELLAAPGLTHSPFHASSYEIRSSVSNGSATQNQNLARQNQARNLFHVQLKKASVSQKVTGWLINPMSMGLGTLAITPLMGFVRDPNMWACISSSLGRAVTPTTKSLAIERQLNASEMAAVQNACQELWGKWADPNSHVFKEVRSQVFGIMAASIATKGLLEIAQKSVGAADDLVRNALNGSGPGGNITYITAENVEVKIARNRVLNFGLKGLKIGTGLVRGALTAGFAAEVILTMGAFALMEPIGSWMNDVWRAGVLPEIQLFSTQISQTRNFRESEDQQHIESALGIFQRSFDALASGNIATPINIGGLVTRQFTPRNYRTKPTEAAFIVRNRFQSWREFLLKNPLESFKNWKSAAASFNALFTGTDTYFISLTRQLTLFRGSELFFPFVDNTEVNIFAKPFFKGSPYDSQNKIDLRLIQTESSEIEAVKTVLQELDRNSQMYSTGTFNLIKIFLGVLEKTDEELLSDRGLNLMQSISNDESPFNNRAKRMASRFLNQNDIYFKNTLYVKDLARNSIVYLLFRQYFRNQYSYAMENYKTNAEGLDAEAILRRGLKCFNSDSEQFKLGRCDFSNPFLRVHQLLGSPEPTGLAFQLSFSKHPSFADLPDEDRDNFPSVQGSVGTLSMADHILTSAVCGAILPMNTNSAVFSDLDRTDRRFRNAFGAFDEGHPLFSRPVNLNPARFQLNLGGYGFRYVFAPPSLIEAKGFNQREICKYRRQANGTNLLELFGRPSIQLPDSQASVPGLGIDEGTGILAAYVLENDQESLLNTYGTSPIENIFLIDGEEYFGLFDVLKEHINPAFTKVELNSDRQPVSGFSNWWGSGPGKIGIQMTRKIYGDFDRILNSEIIPSLRGPNEIPDRAIELDFKSTLSRGERWYQNQSERYRALNPNPDLVPEANQAYQGLQFTYSGSRSVISELQAYEAMLKHSAQFVSDPAVRARKTKRIEFIMNQISGHITNAQQIFFENERAASTERAAARVFCNSGSLTLRCAALNKLISLFNSPLSTDPDISPLANQVRNQHRQTLVQFGNAATTYMSDRSSNAVTSMTLRDPLLRTAFQINIKFAQIYINLLKAELNPIGTTFLTSSTLEEYRKTGTRIQLYIEEATNHLVTMYDMSQSVSSAVPDDYVVNRNSAIFRDSFLNQFLMTAQ